MIKIIIQVRTQDVFPQTIGQLVIAAIKQFSDEIKEGVLISIDKNRARARILPLE